MNYITGAAVLAELFPALLSNITTPVFHIAKHGALANFILPSDHIIVIGGMPGVGKSSFVTQVAGDFLRINVDRRALIANVEMSPEELLTREISRLSGVYLGLDRAELSEDDKEHLKDCKSTLDSYMPRLAILPMPFTLDDIIEAIESFNPTLVVIDYLQCIDTGDGVGDGNERLRLNRIITRAREYVADRVIIVVSALKRTTTNYNPKDLGLDSFRESGGIEYGCNFGFLMVPDLGAAKMGFENRVILRHLKSRSTDKNDLNLVFDGRIHRWTGVDDGLYQAVPEPLPLPKSSPAASDTKTALQSYWSKQRRMKAANNVK